MAGPRGLEPRTSGLEGVNRTNDKSISKILTDFEKFCKVDLRLSDRTADNKSGHIFQIDRFLKTVEKLPSSITVHDVRDYLLLYRPMSPHTYANVLKSLKVFFRDYMRMPWIVESFRFPKRSFHINFIPNKEDLQKFYSTLEGVRNKAAFLMYATTGLRRNELLSLKVKNIDLEKRMIVPEKGLDNQTKHTWITFFNDEAETVLREYLLTRGKLNPEDEIFPNTETAIRKAFRKARLKTNVKISPKNLREWFCSEMGRLGVPDRYIDAFCGRVPRSILARHYTDYSPERLKEIYDKVKLIVLNEK